MWLIHVHLPHSGVFYGLLLNGHICKIALKFTSSILLWDIVNFVMSCRSGLAGSGVPCL